MNNPGCIRAFSRTAVYGCVALILSCNYFAFQVELFDAEYEQNQPLPTESNSLYNPTVNWESFDKDHAQQPFVIDALLRFECRVALRPIYVVRFFDEPTLHPIRDKSPPSAFVNLESSLPA